MFIAISHSEPAPLYEQIEKQIKEQIIGGRLHQGEALPSIRVLAKELEISVITIKKAYENLELEGYINTRAGKGSYVSNTSTEFIRDKMFLNFRKKFVEIIDECIGIGLDPEEIYSLFSSAMEENENKEV